MTTFIIFLILSVMTFLLIYFKIEQMKEMGMIGNAIGKATGLDDKYKPLLDKIAYFVAGLTWLKWVFIPIGLFFILIISWILSNFIDFIIFLISLF
jgi:hypothetical protein